MLNKDRYSLQSILSCIEKIQSYISRYSDAEDFFDTVDFEATLMNYIVISEMIEKLSLEVKQNYLHIPWEKIKSFRNVIAHNYFGVNADEVWQISRTHLVQLQSDILEILGSVE